ncbi:MAG: glycosyltransferase [Acidobacteriota bacterium]|nr:glycosyltransferase [Acidobacteriota bacterium]
MRVTAALIVRDEAEHLRACLQAAGPLVDEIVVVDTGSDDDSPAVAEAAGAHVIYDAWRDDFARPRNLGLEAATGDWILYLDADERVAAEPGWRQRLEAPDVLGARVAFRAASHLTPYTELRLFRSRPDLRFRGAIHETVVPDVEAVAAREGVRVVDAPEVFVEHLGYEGDRTPKYRRDLPILRRAVEDDPDRLFLWHALGEAALGLGRRVEAERAWRRGVEVARRAPGNAIGTMLWVDLISMHFAWETIEDVEALVDEALVRSPEDPAVLWWSARWSAEAGDPVGAERRLRALLERGEPKGPGAVGVDRRLFGELGWALLGSVLLAEGRDEEALRYLRLAAERRPDDAELRAKRSLAESRLTSA